jgi:hypothetical protein
VTRSPPCSSDERSVPVLARTVRLGARIVASQLLASEKKLSPRSV